MKRTVEISDSLLREVRSLAAREGVTIRNLVERGLHDVISETKHCARFKLRNASFKAKACSTGFVTRRGSRCGSSFIETRVHDRSRH